MKKISLVIILINLVWSQGNSQNLTNKKDSVSYALGIMLLNNMKQQGIEEINVSLVTQALEAGLAGDEVLLYPDEASLILRNYVMDRIAKKNAKLKEEGNKFLMVNAKREGVIELPSGLQYEIVAKGDGPSPLATDKVQAHYKGTLIDGSVFDSSYDRGEPLTLPVKGVIKGWQEALELMKVGDKWKLYIPYDLAYGPNGAGKDIPPYATLIFELELLSIL